MPAMHIRALASADAPAFRPLRLRALRDHAEAFTQEVEEAMREDFAALLEPTPDTVTLGAFEGDVLVGTATLGRQQRRKSRHKAYVWGVYVSPEARGTGVGRALMERIVALAREMPGLEQLHLLVITANAPAIRLYESLGFVRYGVEPHAIKHDAGYSDDALMILTL